MAEALSFSEAAAVRQLQASQREAARRQQLQAEIIAVEEEELAELASQEEEAQAARSLAASQRKASRGKGGGNDLALITDTAGEITDLITAAVEIETIVVPLILLANYHVRFLSGNLGVLPEAGGPLSYALDKCMEIASAGAKTAGKTAGKFAASSAATSAGNPTGGGGRTAAAGGGSRAGGKAPAAEQGASSSPIGNIFDVKKLAIWQVFILVTIDVLLALVVVVNLLVLFIVPLMIIGGVTGTVVAFCLENRDLCSAAADLLGEYAPDAVDAVLN